MPAAHEGAGCCGSRVMLWLVCMWEPCYVIIIVIMSTSILFKAAVQGTILFKVSKTCYNVGAHHVQCWWHHEAWPWAYGYHDSKKPCNARTHCMCMLKVAQQPTCMLLIQQRTYQQHLCSALTGISTPTGKHHPPQQDSGGPPTGPRWLAKGCCKSRPLCYCQPVLY